MPDHIHLILMGLKTDSTNQRTAIEFLRKHTRPFLNSANWQQQAHDHVLREHERDHGAFQTIAHYILANPQRAGLVDSKEDHPFLGCSVPGYPDLNPIQPSFWEKFWRIHNRLIAQT